MRLSFVFQFPLVVLSAFLLAGSVAYANPDNNEPNFDIVTLWNRADLISGGDALVEISVPHNVPLQRVTRLFDDKIVDVTAMFRTDAAARTMRGVVTGLAVGTNTLIADSNGIGNGRPRASLTITNHPIGGPVLLAPDAALGLRHAHAGDRSGDRRHDERERAVDVRRRRAMQHRHRVQALLPHHERTLLEFVARSEPAGPPAGKRLLQAVYGRRHAPPIWR